MATQLMAPQLSPTATANVVGAGAHQTITLESGRAYEVRASADVLVRPGGGVPLAAADVRIRADSPMVVVVDVDTVSIIAATGSDATVTFRPFVPLLLPSSSSSSSCRCGGCS